MKLVYRLKFEYLQKNGAAIGQNMGRSYCQRIVTRDAIVSRRKFRRTVGRAVAVVPCLGEMMTCVADHFRVDGQREGNANAVLMNMEPTREDRKSTRLNSSH